MSTRVGQGSIRLPAPIEPTIRGTMNVTMITTDAMPSSITSAG